ncbi:DUF4440 domain-containing protein [Alteromonadaceae bacterium M269]|nr:DUF4440 domain-containing protein [Alteromonadaceae bacterium M269]
MDIDFDEIMALEIELSQPTARKNLQRLSELIADDFEEFGSSGRVFNKDDIISELQTEDNVTYEIKDFRFTALSASCVLVKYVSIFEGKSALRSSIWIKRAEQWVVIHHQGTRCYES